MNLQIAKYGIFTLAGIAIGYAIEYPWFPNTTSPKAEQSPIAVPIASQAYQCSEEMKLLTVHQVPESDSIGSISKFEDMDTSASGTTEELGILEDSHSSGGNIAFSRLINFTASHIPQETLYRLLDGTTPFNRDELEGMSDPVSFIGRVAELATGVDLGYQQENTSANTTIPRFLVDQKFQPGENLSVINPETTRIFTHFQTPEYTRGDVLVKWYQADTNLVLSFKRYPINPGNVNHYVWLDNRQGWNIGNYIVEIYATDESLALLSSGNYYVSN